ncbi:flagellar protein FliT [Litorivivens sp.]|uniref:flagellar protein FliT n=1 Tax=Litorivivens sp. TaxID=2020868 RepID=UPI003562014A
MNQTPVISIQRRALAACQVSVDRLLEMSQAIKTAAEAGDWELALHNQRIRSRELENFYSDKDNMPQEVAELIAAAIREILAIDAQVTELACDGKANLAQEAALKLRQGKAAKAYLSQDAGTR